MQHARMANISADMKYLFVVRHHTCHCMYQTCHCSKLHSHWTSKQVQKWNDCDINATTNR